MKQRRATEHENSQALLMLLPLLGERAGVRASVSSNLIFGVVGSNSLGKSSSFEADYSEKENRTNTRPHPDPTPTLSPRRGGRTHISRDFSRSLAWHCFMEPDVGCYFVNGLLTPSRALERVPIL